jgi:hypothetical protein
LVKISEITSEKKHSPCCTWQDETNCQDCSNKEHLDCRWDRKHVLRFLLAMSPALLITFGSIIIGGIFSHIWWPIGLYIGYFTLFFIIETRILCSHCPYYSKEGFILHCLANHGFIKFYRYHPEPLNSFERVLLIIGFALFCIIPVAGQIPSIVVITSQLPSERIIFITLLALLGFSIVGIIFSFTFLFTRICTKCVNFSCPFNKVPKELVDLYLNKNPVMKKAWIEHNYNLVEDLKRN